MSVYAGPEIVSSGLILSLDAGNTKSYPGSGTTWTDMSGNGNHATLFNGPTFSSSSGGGYISFDNTDDYIATSTLNCNKTFYSIEWWMYPLTLSNYNCMIQFDSGWGSFAYHTGSAGQYWVGTNANSGGRIADADAGSVVVNTWQQWVWTFNNGVGTVYKNGSLLRSQSGLPLSAVSSFSTFSTPNSGGSRFGTAYASSFKVYSNKVLSADEVKQNYNALRGRYGL